MINSKINIKNANELERVENFVEVNPAKIDETDPILKTKGPVADLDFAGSPNFTHKSIEDQLREGLIISFGFDYSNTKYVQLVKDVSEKLVEAGYMVSKISEFNEELKNAIISFQKANSLNVTSVIDYELYLKLINNKDVVIKKDYHEKKTDAAASGEVYALPPSKEDWRGIYFEEEEQEYIDISDEPSEDPDEVIEEDTTSNKDFDVERVSASSGVSAAMIMAFIKGESGGNPNAKAFNGDNYCKCLGWGSSPDTERFMKGLEGSNITGSSYINKQWVAKTRFGFEKSYSDWKANEGKYKSQSYFYRSGYMYWDTAYFNAHKEGTNSQKAFDLAYSINPRCAVESTAWGMAQVMGSHLVKTHKEILDKENGKVAREYFDNISLLASSDMYVSWVKAAGRFSSKNKSNISYASKYNVPEVLGATYLDVIGMAEKDPSKYGYFLFLTRKYYGTFDKTYATRLQRNFKKYKGTYTKRYSSKRNERIIKRSKELFKMKSSQRKKRVGFLKKISENKK